VIIALLTKNCARVRCFAQVKVNLAFSFFLSFLLFFELYAVLIQQRIIMGGLTTEEFKKWLEKALEPLLESIDELKKSIATIRTLIMTNY